MVETVMQENYHYMRMIQGVKDPEILLDMICFICYMAGKYEKTIPVEESRKIFEEIKKYI